MNYWRGSRVTTNFSSITHPPVLDGSTGKVHFFGISTGAGSPQVVQTDTALGSVVTATVGNANSPQVHAGTFDNAYFTSTGATGYLYVCGHDNASTNHPTLYRIHLASGVMSNTNDGSSLSLGTGTGACSPLSEIYNSGQSTGTDWLFVGIPGNCAFSGSSTGCVESFNITSGFPATAAAAGATSGGTSGIVVDNVSTSGHASSLYYSTLARQPAPAPAGRAAAADARFKEHNRGCNNMSRQNRINPGDPGAQADRPSSKRPYQRPAFRHERVFETRALVCGKINGTQGHAPPTARLLDG